MRPRQLPARTLLLGMLLAAGDDRPAHLTRVHRALIELPGSDDERRRLGVLADWRDGPHQLTYRQVERTFRPIVCALRKPAPDGSPSEALSEVIDALLEASVQAAGPPASSALAIDWTDYESFSRPPAHAADDTADDTDDTAAAGDTAGDCADPEASWGHRRGNHPGAKDELFYGYYLQVATIVKDDDGPAVPELVRRIQLTACHVDPPQALVPVLEKMVDDGSALGDVLADSGYASRKPEHWALPLRRLGADLVVDLHPNDRGPHGTHNGATINLYCPATPQPLLELGPLARGATPEQTAAHDQQAAELSGYKLSPITNPDGDGYHRVACPATQGKLRCPLRPASMTLPHTRPEVLEPPQHPPTCCTQQTLTVPPAVNAKTTQKHDYPSAAHRRSYRRRTAAERAYATIKDAATHNLSRGWCRLMGLTPIALFTACVSIARNRRIADSFAARQAEDERRAANGLAPKRRKRRRQTAADLIGAANAPP